MCYVPDVVCDVDDGVVCWRLASLFVGFEPQRYGWSSELGRAQNRRDHQPRGAATSMEGTDAGKRRDEGEEQQRLQQTAGDGCVGAGRRGLAPRSSLVALVAGGWRLAEDLGGDDDGSDQRCWRAQEGTWTPGRDEGPAQAQVMSTRDRDRAWRRQCGDMKLLGVVNGWRLFRLFGRADTPTPAWQAAVKRNGTECTSRKGGLVGRDEIRTEYTDRDSAVHNIGMAADYELGKWDNARLGEEAPDSRG